MDAWDRGDDARGAAGQRLTALVGEEVDLGLQHVELRRRQLFAVGALASVAAAGIAALTLVVHVEVPGWVGWALLVTTLVFLAHAALQERTLRRVTRGAVEQQRRTRELEDTVGELTALHEIAQRVNAVLLPEEIYGVVLDGAVELLGATRGTIQLRVGDQLAVAASAGATSPPVGSMVEVPGLAIDDPVLLEVLEGGTTWHGVSPPRLIVPVTVGRRHVGVLDVARPHDASAFTDRLALVAQLFAEEAATAFVNANRYDLVRSRTEELMAAEEARHEAVADMVHDLRAPLAGLSGYAQLLRDRFEELGPERRQVAVRGICDQSDLLAGLIEGVFESASAEARAVRVREPVDLSATVRAAAATVEHGVASRGRTCNVTVDVPDEVTVESDPEALLRIATNLIANAVEHGGPDVIVRLQRRPREVRLHVADRGDGIPEAELQELFRRRVRPDGSPRGRGLPLVDGLVRAIGGHIAVRSQLGVGSVFTVRLPLAR